MISQVGYVFPDQQPRIFDFAKELAKVGGKGGNYYPVASTVEEGDEVIRVEAKLDRFGLGTMVESLGDLVIINDGSGTREVGNYEWSLSNSAGDIVSTGKHKGHIRSNGSWPLIKDCLDQAAVYNVEPRKEASNQLEFTWSSNSRKSTSGSYGGSNSGPKVAA